MSFHILPLEATDEDLNAVVRIIYASFKPALGCLYIAELSDASFAKLAQNRASSVTDPNGRAFKAVESSTGKMVGVATWKVYPENRSEQEVEESIRDFSPYHDIPEMRPGAWDAFSSGIKLSRKEVLGTQAHVMLGVLAVHTDYQKRGIGNMLMQWGIDEVDRLGVIGYLESSEAGRKLYKSFGFEPVRDILFDTRLFGGDRMDVHVTMIRQPRNGSST